MAIKKDWYQIFAPPIFGKRVIAETLCSESEHILGRTVHISLAELTNNISKFYMIMHFKIVQLDGHNAFTEFVGHNIMTDQIYRMVSKGKSRIDNVEGIVTKDGKKIRIKILTILYKKSKTSVKSAVRKTISNKLQELIKNKTVGDIVKMIVSGDLQKGLKESVKKIYPVRTIEIRKSEIISGKNKSSNA